MCRSPVPSRACRLGGDVVVEQCPVDDVGQASLQAAHGLVGGLPGGHFPVVVGPSFGAVAELNDRHHVEHRADLSVPAAGEPVVLSVPGGHIDRGGADPGREVKIVGSVAAGTACLAGPAPGLRCRGTSQPGARSRCTLTSVVRLTRPRSSSSTEGVAVDGCGDCRSRVCPTTTCSFPTFPSTARARVTRRSRSVSYTHLTLPTKRIV